MVAESDCLAKTKALSGKKVSKPLMEKKRRARINKCLDQLKSLLENAYSNNIRKRKLEKADILELTVKHLKHLQRIQKAPAMNSDLVDYQAGFRSCLAGVNQYLQTADTNAGSRSNLLRHLSSSLLHLGGHVPDSSTMDSELPKAPVPVRTKRRLLSASVVKTVPACLESCATMVQNAGRIDANDSSWADTTREDRMICITNVHGVFTKDVKNTGFFKQCSTVTIDQCSNELPQVFPQNYWRPW